MLQKPDIFTCYRHIWYAPVGALSIVGILQQSTIETYHLGQGGKWHFRVRWTLGTRQGLLNAGTDEAFAYDNGFHGRKEFPANVDLENVPLRSVAECCGYNINVVLFAYEQYLRLWYGS